MAEIARPASILMGASDGVDRFFLGVSMDSVLCVSTSENVENLRSEHLTLRQRSVGGYFNL